jgi:hypothetical protein
MISGLLGGSSGDTTPPDEPDDDEEPGGDEDPDFDENPDMDFGTDFDLGAFEPEDEPEGGPECEPEDEARDIDEIITDVMNSYTDNLFQEIEKKKDESKDATEEEKEAVKEDFVQKEADALAGLVNISNNANDDTTIEDDVVKESVDAVLKSEVCMNTVSDSVENNAGFTEKIQEATEGMSEQTKSEIQSKIESSLEDFRVSDTYDEEKEKQYHDLANLFGITLGGASHPAPS